MSEFTLFEVTDFKDKELQKTLKEFEDYFVYPMGDLTFKLNHGNNYFHFFKRMGEVRTIGYKNNIGEIIMLSTGILRNIENQEVWYLCDLKINPEYVGKRLTLRILKDVLTDFSSISDKAYGIQMNEKGKENRTSKLLTKFNKGYFSKINTLVLFTLTKNELLKHKDVIEQYKGYMNTISLKGVKDIVIQETNTILPLIHLEFTKTKDNNKLILDDNCIYMFSTLQNSNLYKYMIDNDIEINSTASITQHGMDDFNFEFINTSDI